VPDKGEIAGAWLEVAQQEGPEGGGSRPVAAVLVALLVPLGLAAATRTPGDGLVALQLAGTITTVAVLLMAVGLGREPLGDLALVLALAVTDFSIGLPGLLTIGIERVAEVVNSALLQ